ARRPRLVVERRWRDDGGRPLVGGVERPEAHAVGIDDAAALGRNGGDAGQRRDGVQPALARRGERRERAAEALVVERDQRLQPPVPERYCGVAVADRAGEQPEQRAPHERRVASERERVWRRDRAEGERDR